MNLLANDAAKTREIAGAELVLNELSKRAHPQASLEQQLLAWADRPGVRGAAGPGGGGNAGGGEGGEIKVAVVAQVWVLGGLVALGGEARVYSGELAKLAR